MSSSYRKTEKNRWRDVGATILTGSVFLAFTLQVPSWNAQDTWKRTESDPMKGWEGLCILVFSANSPVSRLEDTCKYTSTTFPLADLQRTALQYEDVMSRPSVVLNIIPLFIDVFISSLLPTEREA